MGLDVGVVKASYLDRPEEPTYDFLYEVAERAGCDDTWGHCWEGNAFVEIMRGQMLAEARKYARKHSLDQGGLDKLLAWVRGLPWDGETIMLNLNW